MSRGLEDGWIAMMYFVEWGIKHHTGFSARWRRRAKVKPNSERQTHTSYLRLITNFGLSLVRFRVISICLWTGTDVMPVSPLGGVVGQD